MRVMHVITGLGAGGAEAMLCKLVTATGHAGVSSSVVSLIDAGVYGPTLGAAGVEVSCLGMRPGVPSPRPLAALSRMLRRQRPDVVQSWMYHADLLAGVACATARVPLVWGIHYSEVDPHRMKPATRWIRSACARLSGILPDRIVCCGDSARRAHIALGYRADRMVVIPNGFEVDRFRPDPEARERLRAELGIGAADPVVGLVARLHPDKDPCNFVQAAGRVAARSPQAAFLLVGDGAAWDNPELSRWIDEAGIRSRVRLLGRRSDVQKLLPALDVLASSSRTEGFPQILGEAMLCGVACAATDCGDSREIVGTEGRVVPSRDPDALARAILDLLELPPEARAALGRAARERIRTRYDLSSVARRYVDVHTEVVEARRHRGAAVARGA